MELSTVTMKIHLSELQCLNLKTILINIFNIFNSLPSKAPFRGENVVTILMSPIYLLVYTARQSLISKSIIKKASEVTEQPKGLFPVSRNFYVRTCVKFTFANKIEAIHESCLVSVKVEPRLTSRLSSALFILPLFYLRDYNLRALTCAGKDTSVKITNQTSPQASIVPFSKRKGQGTRLIQEDKARVLGAKTDYPTTLMLQVVYTSMFHMKIYSPLTD